MKKFLNISVIAALAALPMMANAAVTDADPGQTNSDAPVATYAPKYSLAAAGDNDNTHMATAGYVKGAYNAAIKAINKLDNTKQDALSQEQLTAISNVSSLSSRMDSAESDITALETTVGDSSSGLVKAVTDNTSDITALETTVGDSTSGLVKDVADLQTTVGDSTSGLVKAVTDNTSDISALETTVGDSTSGLVKAVTDNTSDITALETTVGDSTSGLVKDVADLQANSLTASDLTDYATKNGVESAIETATITATVPTLTTWGVDSTTGTVDVTVTDIAATYPAN